MNTKNKSKQIKVTQDAIISLLDGRELSIQQIMHEVEDGQEIWCYSCDNNGKINATLIRDIKTINNTYDFCVVSLDNGSEIQCLSNQLFLMRNGERKSALELKDGDSLMPLYRQQDERGYEQFYSPSNGQWYYTHRSVVLLSQGAYEKGMVVHHINFNKHNNNPNNLRVMTWEDHTKLHMENYQLLNEYATSEKGRQKSAEVMSANWANEDWRKKMQNVSYNNGKKVSKKLKEENRLGFQSMDKEKLSQWGREIGSKNAEKMQTKEAINKRVESFKNHYESDEEFRQEVRDRAINKIQEYNEKLKKGEVKLTEKQLEARRQNGKKLNKDPEKRKLAQMKTTYKRFYKDKYESFEEYVKDKHPDYQYKNHKISKVEIMEHQSEVCLITLDMCDSIGMTQGVFIS